MGTLRHYDITHYDITHYDIIDYDITDYDITDYDIIGYDIIDSLDDLVDWRILIFRQDFPAAQHNT